MYELKVENSYGDILNLSTDPRYTLYNITGLTPPQATINSSVNTTQDGSEINSARVEVRNIVLYMTLEGDIERNRINLYKYFTPKKKVTLYYKNDTRDVYIEGMVELIECDLFTNKQIAQVSIICGKPYFKSLDTLITSFSNVTSYFEFPFSVSSNGMEISAITTDIQKSIIYTGDIDTGVVITLFATGTVVNPVIYDVSRNTQFKLNMTLNNADTVIINTSVGEKSVQLLRAGVYSNALGYMTPDSEWFTLEAGDNIYAYKCDSGDANLQITFTTTLLYGGV